jgi:hypothetical protein
VSLCKFGHPRIRDLNKASAKQAAAAGQGEGVAVAVALQPKSPPGPRAVARTRARLRRLCLCPLRCGVGCCLLCFCLCMPPIYRANQPTRQGKRAAASAWPPQSAPRLARGTCAHPLPCHDGLPFLFPVTFNSFSFRASSACRTFSFSASCLLQETRRDDPCPLESRDLFRLTSDHEWLLASEPWTVTGIAGNVRHHNYKVRDHTAVALTSYAG